MTTTFYGDDFTPSLGCLLAPSLDKLATQLFSVTGLNARERDVILKATRQSLLSVLHGKLTRLLLLELNAARVTGRLRGADSSQRWVDFLTLSSRRNFWDEIGKHYPSLLDRIDCIIRNRCAASLLLAQRWAMDRASLSPICGDSTGELEDVTFGAGDSHRGGFTVALLRCGAGRIVYKPRSVAIDAALHRFLNNLTVDHDGPLSFRIPSVLSRDNYGWAEFVEHRYASGEAELREFYRGIGHCLAIMHLLGGSDLHAENLIANGSNPVIVDCETMFTPRVRLPSMECGQALDYALELVSGGVLGIGLLPGKGQALGWRGIDYSGIGSLQGRQSTMQQPTILRAGTDEAYLGMASVPTPATQNHPSLESALALYWPDTLASFQELTATLLRLDAAGRLRPHLQVFVDCRVRVILRPTETYTEIARMLWHPVSLHNDTQARQRAHDLLAKMAENIESAPSDSAVIQAEVEDLMVGDIPIFTAVVNKGQLEGPRDTHWLDVGDLAKMSLHRWRTMDLTFESNVIRAAMVSAYLNDGWTSHLHSLTPQHVRAESLDARRRTQLARIMQSLVKNAILQKDNSVTWVAPALEPTGWSVLPMGTDLYAGLSGVALLGGAYLREVELNRADPVEGVQDVFEATLHSLRLAEFKMEKIERSDIGMRPPPVGGFIGLGSQIWTLLTLASWSGNQGGELQRARTLAEKIPEAIKADETNDLLTGSAGAIPPLLLLAVRTQDERFLDIARGLGDRLHEQAQYKNGSAYWKHQQLWPKGIGGFSHGVSGVGWALTKLARITGQVRYEQLADAAFTFEESLFDAEEHNWVDLRDLGGLKTAALWCHGSVGIGLAHLDLDPYLEMPRTRHILQRAAAATARMGLGWNHCLCHGDLGSWELLHQAIALGEAPEGLSRVDLQAHILTSIEDYSPSCGMTREVFAPGLLPGVGGVAYQLLRMHPDSQLPSVLTLGST